MRDAMSELVPDGGEVHGGYIELASLLGDERIIPAAGGLGMGLSIVRGIVEANGGKIWVEPGKKGARFVFELPAVANGRAN